MLFCNICLSIYLIYALGIIIFFRYQFNSVLKSVLTVDPDLLQKWLPFQRYDYLKWRKWEIYLSAITLFPLKTIICLCLLVISAVVLSLGSIKLKCEAQFTYFRYHIIRCFLKVLVRTYLFICGFYWITLHKVNYSNYDVSYDQSEEDLKKQPSIIVSNHVSWWDSFFHIYYYMPSFLAKGDVKRMPIISQIAKGVKCIFVERDSRSDKDGALRAIQTRVDQIKEGQLFPPILIFPEGTTTNGKYILPFKKGAFTPLEPIKIICLKYQDRYFNVSFDNVGLLGVFIAKTQFLNKLEVYEFNGVYNPKFLYDPKLSHDEKISIYTTKTREIIQKCLKLTQTESGLADSYEYSNMLFAKKKKD